jgi:hypothetical protein
VNQTSTEVSNGSGEPDEYQQNCYETEHTYFPLPFSSRVEARDVPRYREAAFSAFLVYDSGAFRIESVRRNSW